MAKTIKYTYRDWVPFLSSEGDVDKRLVVSKTNVPSTTTSFLSIGFKTYYPWDFDPNVGDTLDITYDITIPKTYWDTADDGTTAIAEKFISYILNYTSQIKVGVDYKSILIKKTSSFNTADILDALADPTKAIRIYISKLKLNTPGSSLYVEDAPVEIVFIDSPSRVKINDKKVSSISINGEDVKELEIDGHPYKIINDITVSQQEVSSFVTANTTWTAGVATIDTTAKLRGLDVTYSKSIGIADSEQITATVKYDSAVADTLNGGITDMVVSGIYVVNPDRTITEKQVTDYADAHIAWPTGGSTGIATTYEIKASDYSTVKIRDGLNHVLLFEGLSISSYTILKVGETLKVTFNNDITGFSADGSGFTTFNVTPVHTNHGYTIGNGNPSKQPLNFKAGETWIFEMDKEPIKEAGPQLVSANLDVTKWGTEVDIASTLYTPDLHMVDGKEVTLTVQPVDGFTVNGQPKFDVQYTPSSVPVTDEIGTNDYTYSHNTDANGVYKITGYSGSLTGLNKTNPLEYVSHGDFATIKSLNKVIKIEIYNSLGTLVVSYVYNVPNDYSYQLTVRNEKIRFEDGKDPVKVS